MTQLEILNKEGKERTGCLHKEPRSTAVQSGLVTSCSCPAPEQPWLAAKRRVRSRLLEAREVFTLTDACKA